MTIQCAGCKSKSLIWQSYLHENKKTSTIIPQNITTFTAKFSEKVDNIVPFCTEKVDKIK